MKLHVIDGTFELFRCFFGAPSATGPDGREVGAVRGMIRTFLSVLREDQSTHVAAAFDRVIESFRNDLFEGYKTGSGIEPSLLQQFPLAERAARALGVTVWPMVRFEADDAMATAAYRYRDHVDQVVLCSPDKDLAQCVVGDRVVLQNRIRRTTLDEAGVLDKFGVLPISIPDWLALVGDNADGIPGIPRWGAKSAGTVLRRYEYIDAIPDSAEAWDVKVRGAQRLAENLRDRRGEARLYRELATLRLDVPIPETLEELRWHGADRERMESLCDDIGDRSAMDAVHRWR